jgi:hypothetical protein
MARLKRGEPAPRKKALAGRTDALRNSTRTDAITRSAVRKDDFDLILMLTKSDP